MPLPAPSGALQADRASFRMGPYMLLRNVSFSIEPGEFLGIIGPSGAGKTTLCRLILGIWPSRGKLCLDGMETFSWNKEELGKYIGYLPQEIELFPGTVAENIARLGAVDSQALYHIGSPRWHKAVRRAKTACGACQGFVRRSQVIGSG